MALSIPIHIHNPNPNHIPIPIPNPIPIPIPIPISFKRTLQKLRWHDTQVMPYLKPSMGDSTLHSVSVVAVVSERQG